MSQLLPEYSNGPSARLTSSHYLTLTWATFYGLIVMKLINGPDKKLKGGEHKPESEVSK